jgi:hypothetical protein
MLIRFIVDNILSFGDRKEFTTIPNSRLKTLQHHKYNFDGISLLKMASIYGSNGAGKSNLIKSLLILKNLVTENPIPFSPKCPSFKFNDPESKKKQTMAIEFIESDTPFYYGLELLEGRIVTEELYLSGLEEGEDQLLFERKTDENSKTTLSFSPDFEKDEKSQLLKSILLEEFVKAEKPVIKFLANRENKFLKNVKTAFNWFENRLHIINPDSRSVALVHQIERNPEFREYSEKLIKSLHLGIGTLDTSRQEAKDLFGDDDLKVIEGIARELDEAPDRMIGLRQRGVQGGEIILTKEDGKIWARTLKTLHTGRGNRTVPFELHEESDGTIRLLDFLPAFYGMVNSKEVFVIDEIERSLHPLLVKELVRKFSLDSETNGQLIFSTHESNLLDQDIFRQDEIWFAEKNKAGATDLYSLNDFKKEHKTIDVRKGYLKGRYGSIPFLGNLHDLNWHHHDYKS